LVLLMVAILIIPGAKRYTTALAFAPGIDADGR